MELQEVEHWKWTGVICVFRIGFQFKDLQFISWSSSGINLYGRQYTGAQSGSAYF